MTTSSNVKFSTRELYYCKMINNFYKKCTADNIKKMIQIIDGSSIISLRILDWFVTRYSNKKKIFLDSNDDPVDVHISYKAQLKSYKKKYFDPFKRRTKFFYDFNGTITTPIQTTIGQLNFFRWAIESNVISYVEKNYVDITNEMGSSNKEDKKRKKEKQIKKLVVPQQIKKLPIDVGINVKKQIVGDQVKIILTFD